MPISPTIERIKGRIKALGVTQKELARMTEINQAMLSRILSGKTDCVTATADKIEAALDEIAKVAEPPSTSAERNYPHESLRRFWE